MERQNSAARRAISHLTVEPIVFLFCIGMSITYTVFRPATLVKICHEVGQDQFPGEIINCQKLREYPPSFSQEIQRRSAQLNTWNQIAGTVPPFIANFVLSAWSDHVGRKSSMLIGLVGSLASSAVNLLIIAISQSPLWLIPVSTCVFGFTGTLTVFITACNQYLADEVKDKRTLTFRMTLLMAAFTTAFTIGSIAASLMLRVLSEPMVLMVGQIVSCPSVLAVLLCVKQHPPSRRRYEQQASEVSVKTVETMASIDSGVSSNNSDSNSSHSDDTSVDYKSMPQVPENMPLLPYLGFLIKDIWRTFTKPRHNRRRFYLWFSLLAYFSIGFGSEGFETLNSTYVMTPPLSFTESSYGIYMAWAGICVTVGSLAGGAIFKCIGMSDTLIMVISMVSTTLDPLVYAFARHNWVIYIAPVVGSMGMLVVGAFQSFLTALVEPDEIGKVLAGQSFSSKIADLLSGVLINEIYKETVTTYRGTAYIVASGLCAISTMLLFGIYLGTKDLMAESRMDQQRRKEERKAAKDNISQADQNSVESGQQSDRY